MDRDQFGGESQEGGVARTKTLRLPAIGAEVGVMGLVLIIVGSIRWGSEPDVQPQQFEVREAFACPRCGSLCAAGQRFCGDCGGDLGGAGRGGGAGDGGAGVTLSAAWIRSATGSRW